MKPLLFFSTTLFFMIFLSGCVTSTVQQVRQTPTAMQEGDSIVVIGRRNRPSQAEAELDFIDCVGRTVGSGRDGVQVISEQAFMDAMFPWFEPRTAPLNTQGGSLSCTITPGGGGCFGFLSWENDSSYEASIWDTHTAKTAGRISSDAAGTSYMPAIVVPIPLIARVQSSACSSLGDQLKLFVNNSS